MTPKILHSFKRFFFFLVLSVAAVSSKAQNNIRGRIIYERDAKPASAVSITLANHMGGNVTDQAGNFDLNIPSGGKNDTVIISSVGYQSIKMPVRQALERKEFRLVEIAKDLPSVTVRSFNNEQVIGDKHEKSASFRSWNARKGGEIGRIFPVYHEEYKLNKVRFKVNSFCNACMLRLRVRNVRNGYPAEELLTDSITVSVSKMTMDDKTPEFDLTKYNIILKEKQIYVGLEVLYCQSPVNSTDCSLSFVGTEKGSYFYRSKTTDTWGDTNEEDYSIHLKVYLGY
jgi:hypothetical protein